MKGTLPRKPRRSDEEEEEKNPKRTGEGGIAVVLFAARYTVRGLCHSLIGVLASNKTRVPCSFRVDAYCTSKVLA